jgi:hypothetical protein
MGRQSEHEELLSDLLKGKDVKIAANDDRAVLFLLKSIAARFGKNAELVEVCRNEIIAVKPPQKKEPSFEELLAKMDGKNHNYINIQHPEIGVINDQGRKIYNRQYIKNEV